jgi:hypothetical protein
MTDLSDLITRLEGAEEADRELDARLYVELIARLRRPDIEDMIAARAASHPDENVWLSGARDWQVPPFTSSLDAALGLAERVLPGWWWVVSSTGGECAAEIGNLETPLADNIIATSKTPAVALVLAVLKGKDGGL